MNEHSVVLTTKRTVDEVFDQLLRADEFVVAAPDLESVEASSDGTHHYTLRFRGGVACWTQRTEVDPDSRVLRFEQVAGDFVAFGGTWEVTPTDTGSQVTYRVAFRTSIPHLAGAIDPMIARVLLRTAADIVTGLADPAEVVEGVLHDEVPGTVITFPPMPR